MMESTTLSERECPVGADTEDGLVDMVNQQPDQQWTFGCLEMSRAGMQFICVYLALFTVIGVGLYNMTVGDEQNYSRWGPIVLSCVFTLVPNPQPGNMMDKRG